MQCSHVHPVPQMPLVEEGTVLSSVRGIWGIVSRCNVLTCILHFATLSNTSEGSEGLNACANVTHASFTLEPSHWGEDCPFSQQGGSEVMRTHKHHMHVLYLQSTCPLWERASGLSGLVHMHNPHTCRMLQKCQTLPLHAQLRGWHAWGRAVTLAFCTM